MKPNFKSLEFIYQDTQIHFLFSQDENVMVNATDMAKAFNKIPKDFLILESTRKFIDAFEKLEKLKLNKGKSPYLKTDLFYTKQKSGTFMHRKLALKFAAWLDADFELWIIDLIDNLLFKNYNIHREKSIAIEKAKQEIQAIENNIIKSQNKDAIALLKHQKELKQLQNDKKNALLNQTKIIQLELF